MRYKLLETLRQYGPQLVLKMMRFMRLAKGILNTLPGLAEQAFEERLISQQYWMVELDQEHDNFISALNWSDKNSPDDVCQAFRSPWLVLAISFSYGNGL